MQAHDCELSKLKDEAVPLHAAIQKSTAREAELEQSLQVHRDAQKQAEASMRQEDNNRRGRSPPTAAAPSTEVV